MSEYITEVLNVQVGGNLILESGTSYEPISSDFTANLTCPNQDPISVNYTVDKPKNVITSSGGPVSIRSYEERTRERRKDSFKKIVQSGTIKMSYYDWRRAETECYAAREERQASIVQVNGYRNGARWSSMSPGHAMQCQGGTPSVDLYAKAQEANWLPLVAGSSTVYPVTKKTEFVDHSYSGSYAPPPLESSSTQIESLKSDLVSQLYKRWDAMTDLVEAKASYQTLHSVLRKASGPLSSLKAATRGKKSKRLSLKESANSSKGQWLEYRYGVMPLVYSAQDALKVLRNRAVEFDTVRGSFTTSLDDSFDYGVYRIERVGTRTVRGVGKARYVSSINRLQNSISFNLLNAAWEKTRYSLVVDWFANVGDFIVASTTSFNAEHKFCYAVDERYTDLVYKKTDNGELLVLRYTSESYTRIPFTNKDVILQFRNNFSGWKRWLDAIALSAGPLTKALRRLR